MDFESSTEYLKSFISYEDLGKIDYSGFNLDRINSFARNYGVDYSNLKYVHVGGSKGKGSTSGLVAEYLRKSGKMVGLFTSPYMIDITECFWVGGELISQEQFVKMVEELRAFIEVNGCDLTYFELLTILVLKYFVVSGVEFAVLEVGLGGRLDATNIINPEVVGLTRIEMEHTDVLGDTIEKIVEEKLGIVKEGARIVVGEQSPEVLNILRARLDGAVFVEGGNYKTAYQILNSLLGEVDDDLFEQVVDEFSMVGRCDVRLIEGKIVVFDMAHTPSSIEYLLSFLNRNFANKEFVFLVSIMKDKKVKEIFNKVGGIAESLYLTSSHEMRGYSGGELKNIIGEGKVVEDPFGAFSRGIQQLKKDQILVVTGSHFLISKILTTFKH